MADTKITDLTETSVPALDDWCETVDKSDTTDDAAGSSRKLSLNRLGGCLDPSLCNGRLTLETGVAISTSDQTGKTSVYFTPYFGNRISVFDGTRWKLYSFTELTLALGTLTSGKNYDVFIYDNSGTLTLELSAAWSSDTARTDALTTQDGIYVKSGATTRRYLGTIRTTSTTATEDSAQKRFLWNAYNRVNRIILKADATYHNYTTTSWRAYNNDSTNNIQWVRGLALEPMVLTVSGAIQSTASAYIGISAEDDAGTNWDAESPAVSTSNNTILETSYQFRTFPGIGYHLRTLIEFGGSGATQFDATLFGIFIG